jgi:DNA-binding protein YbaB
MDLKDIDKRLQCLQRQMQEWQQKLRHQLPGEWAEI